MFRPAHFPGYARRAWRGPQRQRGVVLLFALIVLVVMLIGGVAVMRSMNTALSSAGNLAFQRDLVNQGEQGMAHTVAQFQSGGTLAVTTASLGASNYSAVILPATAQGIPNALLSDSAFKSQGFNAGNDLTGATADVTIRYLIERLCDTEGPAYSSHCAQTVSAPLAGTISAKPPLLPTSTLYRISLRVSGARGTQVFLQSTFTKPD